MSWWISLNNAGPVPLQAEGGTYALGGSDEAELNVTYNYTAVTRLVGFRFPDLHGMKASESIPLLQSIVDKLGTHKDADYWAPTPGNAGHAASILLRWAKLYPDATWNVN